MFTKSLHFLEDGIGCGHPRERSSLDVIGSHEAVDFGHQLFDTAKSAAADGLLGDRFIQQKCASAAQQRVAGRRSQVDNSLPQRQ